jgi:hypothetical protein
MATADIQLRSVFPSKDYTTPTPESTPSIGALASPTEPFGGFNIPSNAADEAVQTSRAWSTATRYLSRDHADDSTLPQKHDIEAFDLKRAISTASRLVS